MTGASEPLHLSGIVATAETSTSAYITKDDLVVALASLEGKIADMLNSMVQGVKKWKKSPSPVPSPGMEEEWVDIEKEVVENLRRVR